MNVTPSATVSDQASSLVDTSEYAFQSTAAIYGIFLKSQPRRSNLICSSVPKKRATTKLGWPSATYVTCLLGLTVISTVNFSSYAYSADTIIEARDNQAQKSLRKTTKRNGAEQETPTQASEVTATKPGEHCLDQVDGSHSGIVEWTKRKLRDPNSFEHDRTLITALSAENTHIVSLNYRARNGFGGMVPGTVIAEIDGTTCGLVKVIYTKEHL